MTPARPDYNFSGKLSGDDSKKQQPNKEFKYTPIDLYCEYSAESNGTMKLKVDEDNIYVQLKDNRGNVFLKRTLLKKGSNSIKVPAGFKTNQPYGITLYRGEGPVYSTALEFNGERWHTQKLLKDPITGESYEDTKPKKTKATKAGR